MASADILRAARARIEDPKNWTTGQFARNAKGDPVSCYSRKAVCWCAIGAVSAERPDNYGRDALGFLYMASADLFKQEDISIINDSLGHDAVLRAFDAAIAAAEAEAGR